MSRKAWAIVAPVATMLITFFVFLALHAVNGGQAHDNPAHVGEAARP